MKKSVAIIAGVVIASGGLWLGGAWYTGTRIEAGSPEYVARINDELSKAALSVGPGVSVKFKQLSFERGLFDSQARYAIAMTESGEDGAKATLEFDTRYEHGPFPISALSRGQFTPTMAIVRSDLARTADVEEWFKAAQNATTPMWAEAVVSYDGDADLQAGLAAVKHEENGTRTDFSGADLQGVYTAATKRWKGVFNVSSLTASGLRSDDKPFQFALTGVQMDADVKEGRFGLSMGKVELRADRLSLADSDLGGGFSIEKLVYGGSGDEDERFVQGEAWLRGEALTVNDFVLGSPSLTFKVEQLDGLAFKRVMDALNALSASSANGVIDPGLLDDSFVQDVRTVLDANPVFALDPLRWKTAKGESALSLHTQFGNPGNLNAPAAMIAMQALKSVRIDLALHKPMVIELAATVMQLGQGMDAATASARAQQQVDALADNLAATGFARKDGDGLVSSVQYGNGKIVVNGRDVSMSELMGLMLAF